MWRYGAELFYVNLSHSSDEWLQTQPCSENFFVRNDWRISSFSAGITSNGKKSVSVYKEAGQHRETNGCPPRSRLGNRGRGMGGPPPPPPPPVKQLPNRIFRQKYLHMYMCVQISAFCVLKPRIFFANYFFKNNKYACPHSWSSGPVRLYLFLVTLLCIIVFITRVFSCD